MSDGKVDGGPGSPEEKTPINNVDGKTGDVHVRQPRGARAGCFITRTQGILAVLLGLGIVLLVAVIVALVVRTPCETDKVTDKGSSGCASSASSGHSIGALNLSRLATPKPTVEPSLPWAGIRLPHTLVPRNYQLELRVDLVGFTFIGSSSVDVDVVNVTRYIIVHVNALEVRRHSVTVHNMATNASMKIVRQIHVPENQFYVVETREELKKGEKYRIRYGHFKGLLQDDLRGLYRSMYKDQDGHVRFVTIWFKHILFTGICKSYAAKCIRCGNSAAPPSYNI